MTRAWDFWDAATIARITDCPVDAVEGNWPRIAGQLALCGIDDRPVQMAMIGTVAIESASTFRPVREAFYLGEPEPAETYRKTLRYYPWYGRGYIQITWESNYATYSRKVNDLWGAGGAVDLIARPDDALDPDISAAVAALYFRDHTTVQGYSIPQAARAGDWEWVRRLVQGGTHGLDRLVAIASALDAYAAPGGEPMPVYDLTLPIRTQDNDWDCAQEATLWGLKAAGRNPDDDWMEQDMLADGVESVVVGLTRGDGSLLAEWITREYAEPGANGSPAVKAYNVATVGFDDVRSIAGTSPVLIGGHRWGSSGHWAGVRRYDPQQGTLVLANPAGTGPVYGQQTLDRQQFEARGPWSMVVLQAVGAEAPVPVPIPPADPRDAELVALRERVGGLEIAVAHLADILAGDRLHAVADEARAIREQFLGKRPAA